MHRHRVFLRVLSLLIAACLTWPFHSTAQAGCGATVGETAAALTEGACHSKQDGSTAEALLHNALDSLHGSESRKCPRLARPYMAAVFESGPPSSCRLAWLTPHARPAEDGALLHVPALILVRC